MMTQIERAGLMTPDTKDSAFHDRPSDQRSERLQLSDLTKPGKSSAHARTSDISASHGRSSIRPVRPVRSGAPVRELEMSRSHSQPALHSLASHKNHDLFNTLNNHADSSHDRSTFSSMLHRATDPRTPSTALARTLRMQPFDRAPPVRLMRQRSQLADEALRLRSRQRETPSSGSSYQRHIDTGVWDSIQPGSSHQPLDSMRASSGHPRRASSPPAPPRQSLLSGPSHPRTDSILSGSLMREILGTEPTTEGSRQMHRIANEQWKDSGSRTAPRSARSQSLGGFPSRGASTKK